LKVNDLIRGKGFDMHFIENDQAASLSQLAAALEKGYRPENPREQVFMSPLVADQVLQRDAGRQAELARFDSSLVSVRQLLAPVADLSEKIADSVRKHGYDSRSSIIACIDECLTAAFEHCDDRFDLDGELVLVNADEPQVKWCKIMCQKIRQGGCNYLEDYCDTLCSGGQENACKSCLAFYDASGCPGNIPTGGD
jgi:hypothetical protein